MNSPWYVPVFEPIIGIGITSPSFEYARWRYYSDQQG